MKTKDMTAEQRSAESAFCFARASKDGKWVDGILYSGPLEVVAASKGQMVLESDMLPGGAMMRLAVPDMGDVSDWLGVRVCVTIERIPLP